MILPISVIVATSPGREEQLAHCLQALTRQFYPGFEVIVVDDGSTDCRTVAGSFANQLKLSYLWRLNEGSPACSRNLGARQASHPLLVFIDSDVLLNPGALAAYNHYLAARPQWLLYGYVGLEKEALSVLEPGVTVNWWDPRFEWDGSQLRPSEKLFHSAYECGYSGNFCVHRRSFEAIGGFDEKFRGWGGEDLDLAERALQQGFESHFLLDAWGEHQVHARQEDFHLNRAEDRGYGYVFRPHLPVPYQVRVFASDSLREEFNQVIRSHYLAP